jgi:exodeoxyribonuclease VII large subunit
VGHEIDFTIADFVADLRAPTPSAAAEILTPDRNELLNSIQHTEKQLVRLLKHTLQNLQQNLAWATKHLQQQHPKRKLREQTQRLDMYEITLTHTFIKLLQQKQHQFAQLAATLETLSPLKTLQRGFAIATLNSKILHSIQQIISGDKIAVRLSDGEISCTVD